MVRKAVIPAAGFGTRFLPASKAQPKEMMPIVDTPTIQYVVEEAVNSGITDILIITGKGKRAIEDHFDRSFELEAELTEKGKLSELKAIRRVSELADIHFIRQKELRGLGDAVYMARHHVGNEPFVVLLGDTVLEGKEPITKQMKAVFERYEESVVALEEIPMAKVSRYGVVAGDEMAKNLILIKDFVEKPSPKEAPSNLAIAGRYILTPEIFKCIEETTPGKGQEIQLTDAMRILVKMHAMYGLRFDGKRHDIGSKIDFIKTSIEFALQRKELARELRVYLNEVAKRLRQEEKG